MGWVSDNWNRKLKEWDRESLMELVDGKHKPAPPKFKTEPEQKQAHEVAEDFLEDMGVHYVYMADLVHQTSCNVHKLNKYVCAFSINQVVEKIKQKFNEYSPPKEYKVKRMLGNIAATVTIIWGEVETPHRPGEVFDKPDYKLNIYRVPFTKHEQFTNVKFK